MTLAPCNICELDGSINARGEYWYVYNTMCKTHKLGKHYNNVQLMDRAESATVGTDWIRSYAASETLA